MASVGGWITRALAAVGLAALAGFVAGLLRPRPKVTDLDEAPDAAREPDPAEEP